MVFFSRPLGRVLGGNSGIMLLSDWYARWKEKHLQAAVEAARKHAYEEGYAAGKTGGSEDVQGVNKTDVVTPTKKETMVNKNK